MTSSWMPLAMHFLAMSSTSACKWRSKHRCSK
jgi:hypothetical protein